MSVMKASFELIGLEHVCHGMATVKDALEILGYGSCKRREFNIFGITMKSKRVVEKRKSTSSEKKAYKKLKAQDGL
jgi:hypothetical protein